MSLLEQIVKKKENKISQVTKKREACIKTHLQTLAPKEREAVEKQI